MSLFKKTIEFQPLFMSFLMKYMICSLRLSDFVAKFFSNRSFLSIPKFQGNDLFTYDLTRLNDCSIFVQMVGGSPMDVVNPPRQDPSTQSKTCKRSEHVLERL